MNKAQIISLYEEVKKLINSQLTILSALVDNYDQLDDYQMEKIEKSIRRLKIFFSNESHTQPQVLSVQKEKKQLIKGQGIRISFIDKQELFTQTDWKIIQEKVLGTDEVNKKLFNLINLYQINENHPFSELQVDQKICVNQSFFGYVYNGQATGRGILIQQNEIYYGYFLDGIFEVGIQIKYKNDNFKITIIDQTDHNKNDQIDLNNFQQQINKMNLNNEMLQGKDINIFQIDLLRGYLQYYQEKGMISINLPNKFKLVQKAQWSEQQPYPSYFITDSSYIGFGQVSKTKGQFYVRQGIGFDINKKEMNFWDNGEIIFQIMPYESGCY